MATPPHSDTTRAAQDEYFRRLQQLTPLQSLLIMDSLSRSVRELAMAGLREQYPHADEAELRWRLTALLYGDDFATRVLGDCPDEAA